MNKHLRNNVSAAAASALALTLVGVTLADEPIRCATFSAGGLITPEPLGSPIPIRMAIVGQRIVGLSCAFNNNNSRATLGIGLVPCIVRPTCDRSTTLVRWYDHDSQLGGWDRAANWQPAVVPRNNSTTRYDVTIAPLNEPPDHVEPTPEVLLDTITQITRLTLAANSKIIVDSRSIEPQTFSFSPPGLGETNAFNQGTIELVVNGDPTVGLTIQRMQVNQTGGGKIRVQSNTPAGAPLTLIDTTITGGTFEIVDSGRLRMLDSDFEDCQVLGPGLMLVGDGSQAGDSFADGTVFNNTGIVVAANSSLSTISGLLLQGPVGARVTLQAATSELGGPSGVITNGATIGDNHRIEGSGRIGGEFVNNSIVDAQSAGQTLSIMVPNFDTNAAEVVNHHLLRASAQGHLEIASELENRGVIEALAASTVTIAASVEQFMTGPTNGIIRAVGGTVNIDAPVGGGGQLISQGGGIVNVDSFAFLDCSEVPPGVIARININPGAALGVAGPPGMMIEGGIVSVDDEATLDVTAQLLLAPAPPSNTARLNVGSIDSEVLAGSIRIAAGGQLFVAAGGLVEMRGGYTFENTNEADIAWNSDPNDFSTLRFAASATLEVGGTDVGNVAGGFVNNFDLNELYIGSGVTVTLVDSKNNGNRNGPSGASEALYVDRVCFQDSAGRIVTNGIPIYLSGTIDGGVVCGSPMQIIPATPCPGDVNGDQNVGLTDLSILLANFGTSSGATLAEGDTDGDGDVDLSDLSQLLANFGTSCP